MTAKPFAHIIEHLEKATRPDRSLDWEIHLRDGIDGVGAYGPHPSYTASLDAALTLVPEGSRVREIGQWDESGHPGGWFAHVTRYFKTDEHSWECRSFTYGIQDPMDFHPEVPPLAVNGAIALCIAALKARANQ